MCGIAGIVSSDPEQLSRIRGMTRLIAHRGPDDEGFLFAGRGTQSNLGGQATPEGVYAAGLAHPWRAPAAGCFLALGHRRLSIIDLTVRGHQPMRRGQNLWMVYNGEVFNYLELREELVAKGCTFRTETDTEVIMAAYATWGLQCFERFNGMWAIAIYDASSGDLVLSRDRFGVKPLYYWHAPQGFAFASEIKAFGALKGWHPSCEKAVVGRFLALDTQDTDSRTMFEDVHQLSPGHLIVLHAESSASAASIAPRQQPWYNLRGRAFEGSFEDAAQRFRELFTDAVRLRLRSDASVGFCLSGGLDSSSILCTAAWLQQNLPGENSLQSFTSCSRLARYDERSYAEIAAAQAGASAAFIYPDEERLFRDLNTLIRAQDEPFSSTSIFAQWCVFSASADAGLKVMLDGQGADESLCGYHNFLRPFFRGLVESRQLAAAWHEANAVRGGTRKAVSALLRAVADNLVPDSGQRRQTFERRKRMAPRWMNREVLHSALTDPQDEIVARGRSAGELSVKLLNGAHVQALLHWEDRNSMAHSIESRVPFLDYRLVEFIVGLPDLFKIRNGQTKAVLRSGLRQIVPDEILDRKDKLGFVTPEAEWAEGPFRQLFKDYLMDSLEAARGILTPQLMTDFNAVLDGKRPYNTSFWRALCVGQWMKTFGVSC